MYADVAFCVFAFTDVKLDRQACSLSFPVRLSSKSYDPAFGIGWVCFFLDLCSLVDAKRVHERDRVAGRLVVHEIFLIGFLLIYGSLLDSSLRQRVLRHAYSLMGFLYFERGEFHYLIFVPRMLWVRNRGLLVPDRYEETSFDKEKFPRKADFLITLYWT